MYRIVHADNRDPNDFVATTSRALEKLRVSYPELVFSRDAEGTRVWATEADRVAHVAPVARIVAEEVNHV